MSTPLDRYTFSCVIKLDQFDDQVDILFKKISQTGLDILGRSLTPTFINLKISEECETDNRKFNVMIVFLRLLRKTHEKYFVRFCSSPALAIHSQNLDIFNIRDNFYSNFSDITFFINVISSDKVSVTASIPFDVSQKSMIRHAAKSLNDSILIYNHERSFETILEFVNDRIPNSISTSLTDFYHVLFINKFDSNEYVSIPIFGLSVEDAIRKYKASEIDLSFLQYKYRNIIYDEFNYDEKISVLVNAISESEEFENRFKSSKVTYGLAELLFGYYAYFCALNSGNSAGNEIVLFDVTDSDDHTPVNISRIIPRYISEV